jgi:glycosyltransferase involved in cell wall biosynthesis
VFWYSVDDQSLNIICQNGCTKQKASIVSAFHTAISETLRNRSNLAVLLAFPSSLPGVRARTRYRLAEYFLCLITLKLFGFGRIKTIVDDFDPFVEGLCAFSETEPSTYMVTYARIMEEFTLKTSSFIVVLSDFWKKYVGQTYRVKDNRISVASMGSLVRLVPHNGSKSDSSLMVLYSGSALRVKGIDKLVSSIEKLRAEGMNVDLHIAGPKLMDLPSWVKTEYCDWSRFVCTILLRSDVCVIPYPPARFGFCHSMPAKLFDYMAAGKPIISTDLEEVADIIRSNNCGLVAADWNEFEMHVKRLYENRELATKLGNNGRVAAEKYYDYEILAETFLESLIQHFDRK